MTFLWPWFLVGLVGVLPIVGWWIRMSRARQTRARSAGVKVAARRRHGPFGLMLLGLIVLVIGSARPEFTVQLPRSEGTLVLAFDTSNSMAADDVEPSRLDAAKAAALNLVDRQPDNVRVGVVTFSGAGAVVLAATDDRADVEAAVQRLQPDGGTSIGQGLFTALSAVTGAAIPITAEAVEEGDFTALDIGWHPSAVVIIFSDGERTDGFDPAGPAALAANAGVRVYGVGVGTDEGTVLEVDGFSLATALVNDSLASIAELTEAEYFEMADLADDGAGRITDAIDFELTFRGEPTEATALFGIGGAVLLIAGAAVSVLWFGRVV